MRRILSISGGGCRGFLPALTLVEIERRTGKPCWQLFDAIAGTSVGSILAALLSIGVPASEAIKFFSEDGPAIFTKQFSLGGLLRPKYPDAVLEARLQQRFGPATLAHCKTRLLIPAFDWANEEPFFSRATIRHRRIQTGISGNVAGPVRRRRLISGPSTATAICFGTAVTLPKTIQARRRSPTGSKNGDSANKSRCCRSVAGTRRWA